MVANSHSINAGSSLLTLSQATDKYGLSPQTWRNFDAEGKIVCVRTPGGHRRILESSIREALGIDDSTPEDGPKPAIYCRVSSLSQAKEGSLDKQRARMRGLPPFSVPGVMRVWVG